MKYFAAVSFALLSLLTAIPAFAGTCRINEYAYAGGDANSVPVQIAREPKVTGQVVNFTAATSSAAFNPATRLIRIVCDVQAYFVISNTGATATINDSWLEAHSPEYFGVAPGYKISVYDGS